MLKIIYVIFFVLILTSLMVNAQNTNLLSRAEQLRCIQNDKCDFFENEQT